MTNVCTGPGSFVSPTAQQTCRRHVIAASSEWSGIAAATDHLSPFQCSIIGSIPLPSASWVAPKAQQSVLLAQLTPSRKFSGRLEFAVGTSDHDEPSQRAASVALRPPPSTAEPT